MLGAILKGGASLLGGLLGGASGGQAKERFGQNEFNLGQDSLRNSQYGTQQSTLLQLFKMLEDAKLQRSQIAREAPGQRTRQSIMGSVIQNIQPMSVTPPAGVKMGQISGGLSPALLNQAARMGGADLQKQALLAQLTGSDVPSLPDTQGAMLTPPSLSKYGKPGKGESAMGILSMILGGAGALGGLQKPPVTTPPYNGRIPMGAG